MVRGRGRAHGSAVEEGPASQPPVLIPPMPALPPASSDLDQAALPVPSYSEK